MLQSLTGLPKAVLPCVAYPNPTRLPFYPNYFHPSSEAVGFRDVSLVTSSLASSSPPLCHPDLNHRDSRLAANEPGGWMMGGKRGMKRWDGHVVRRTCRDFWGEGGTMSQADVELVFVLHV